MLTRTILTIALAGFALTGSAQADTYTHIDGLALRLQQYATALDREFTIHYRHTAQYPHLHSDAYEMVRLAAHIHEVAHEQGSLAHLQSDLRQLDRLFHHIEDLVEEIEHDAGFDHFHGHGFHGLGGHIHGHTNHVRRLLKAMEDTLHHLQSDVRELARASEYRHPRGPAFPAPGVIAGTPGFPPNFPGPAIRIGRPGFSIWLGR